ncbi:M23 family metallopeptidase [bacterium]|nr:M23 family metallopeptidase [bacterium]
MPHRKYISVVFAPEGAQRSFAVRLKRWQLIGIIAIIFLGWMFLFAGIVAGIIFAHSMNRQHELIAENGRLREALVRADTLRKELDELRAMKSLMEQAFLVADRKKSSGMNLQSYTPTAMNRSSIFVLDSRLPELSEYLQNQARREAYIPIGLPADGVISAKFGETGGVFKKPHSGIDIVVPSGTLVHSTADGIVADTGENKDYGIYVEIDHLNGYRTIYGHLSKANVSVGDPVKRGAVIGYSGQTGKTIHPHIHYELRYDKKPIDPFLKKIK